MSNRVRRAGPGEMLRLGPSQCAPRKPSARRSLPLEIQLSRALDAWPHRVRSHPLHRAWQVRRHHATVSIATTVWTQTGPPGDCGGLPHRISAARILDVFGAPLRRCGKCGFAQRIDLLQSRQMPRRAHHRGIFPLWKRMLFRFGRIDRDAAGGGAAPLGLPGPRGQARRPAA